MYVCRYTLTAHAVIIITSHISGSSTQELVSALHGLTLLYEKPFHIAALHFSEGKRVATTNLTTSVTPTGWIHVTIDPLDSDGKNEGGTTASTNIPTPHSPLSTSLSGNSPHSISNGINSLPSHAHNGELQNSSVGGPPGDLPPTSRGSISNGEAGEKQFFEDLPKSKLAPGSANLGARNWYQQIWRGMVYLASDPFPKVADAAQHVVHGLHDKVSWAICIQHYEEPALTYIHTYIACLLCAVHIMCQLWTAH